MPHIHEKIDFTASVLIVHDKKVLMIKHKLLGMWLQIGGHIELDEDPETAALREAKEETGLDVELVGENPHLTSERGRSLTLPAFMDIHPFNATHQHIDMLYFARIKSGEVTLSKTEHDDIRWFTDAEIDDPKYVMPPNMRFYAHEAIKRLSA